MGFMPGQAELSMDFMPGSCTISRVDSFLLGPSARRIFWAWRNSTCGGLRDMAWRSSNGGALARMLVGELDNS